MDNSKKKIDSPVVESDGATKVINPATDTLNIDIEKAKASEAILITIRGTPQGKKYILNKDSFTIGRDNVADIQLLDSNVSRLHAKITKEGNSFFIQDSGSRNGTFLNDEQITEAKTPLNKEDMIRLGSTVLKYIPAGELEALYHLNLTNAAYIDKLTNVYNRNYISEVLDAEFKRAKALHTNLSLIIFDIDNFKKINDTYGHDGGDHVLTELGKESKNSGMRERDMIGRFGGEEFLVILPGSNIDQAKEVAERIRKKIESYRFSYSNQIIPVTISLGISEMSKLHIEAKDLYKAADRGLYESKKNGKNRVTTGV